MDFQTTYARSCSQIREQKPLIHHIMNSVTMSDCANMTLAIGASPIMANAPEEVSEVTASAQSLVLNTGTPSKTHFKAMKLAAGTAREKQIPIILDPVGVGVTSFRRQAVHSLLEDGSVTIIRGNASEMKALAGLEAKVQGVDSRESTIDLQQIAEELAKKKATVVAVTGETDLITNGDSTIFLKRGDALLSRITGAGCMTNALIAAFASVLEDPLEAAVLGILTMSLAAERSSTSLKPNEEGPGTFQKRLIDYVHVLTQKGELGGF